MDRPSPLRRWLALGAAWLLPPVIPLVGVGPLTECSHCVANYLVWYPLIPAIPIAAHLGARGNSALIFAALALVCWLIVAWIIATRAPRRGFLVYAIGTALLGIWCSLATAAALRM